MSDTEPRKSGPTAPLKSAALLEIDKHDVLAVQGKGNRARKSLDMLNNNKSSSLTSESVDGSGEEHSDSQKMRTLLRPESVDVWASGDMKSLYNEMDAEKKYLETAANMKTIREELNQIKDDGEKVVDMSQNMKRLEAALKSAAKDKFEQEKVIAHLQTEISELKLRSDSMRNDNKPSNAVSSDRQGLSSDLQSLNSQKIKDQEALVASLHRKINFLQLQNKGDEVDTLKVKVSHLTNTIEKLLNGLQKASENDELSAEFGNLRKSLTTGKDDGQKKLFRVPDRVISDYKCNKTRKAKSRTVWCSELRDSDFKQGPVSFIM